MSRCKTSGGGILAKFRLCVPIGELKITCCSKGLHELHIERAKKFPDFSDRQFDTVELEWEENSKLAYSSIDKCVEYFRSYFDESDSDLMLKMPEICWRGICVENSFSEKVMKMLLNGVGPGQRVSYAELATMSGNSKAQRAVGSVMRKNPIPLIVPCHRVIRSNQTIGNYNGGADIKEWLLAYEKINFQ